ncbi:restriction endonuclease [Dethiothermospora halolimnae]|uniref:restriction endonuclease n=1 Tax=Dethiothermospora halolimnae TaxID=3114390 RepID=UPI003CCC0C5F
MKEYLDKIKQLLKRISKNRKLKRYYYEKFIDGKTITAVFADSIVSKILVLVLGYGYVYIKTKDWVFSLLIAIQFLILYSLVFYKIKKVKLNKCKTRVNNKIAKKIVLKDLQNKTPDEFINSIKETFEKLDFINLRNEYSRNIDFIGNFRNRDVAIKCFQYSSDYKVSINDIREFFLELKEKEISEGIIVTISSFDEDVKDFLPKLQKHIKIHTIDIDKFVGIMKKAETAPSLKDIEQVIINKISERRRKVIEYRNKVLAKGKAIKYLLIGFLIYLYSGLTPYNSYYKIISYILFTLGVVAIINYIMGLLKPEEEEKADSFM